MNINSYISKHIDINNFKNKNIFITGGNSGIGLELAKILASMSANIFLLCRNIDKGNIAKEELLSINNNIKVVVIPLDLADLSSVKSASKEILKYKVDMFVNNAGVYHLDKSYTKDNYEITIGTNFIGTLYLSSLLLPTLSKQEHKVHYLYESSITSKLLAKIDFNDLYMDKKYKKMKIYANSKLLINDIYKYYSDIYKDTNIIFDLTHPGGTYTPLIYKGYKNKLLSIAARIFMKLVFHSPKKASLTMLSALNEEDNSCKGPRGLLEMSGYPKTVKFKYTDNYKEFIPYMLEDIKSRIGK